MDHVVSGLEDKKALVRLAAVRCLHSLSRSVQQLRTSFQDTAVWKPLMKLIQEANDDMMTVGSSALCNLLLEFSPSKEVRVYIHVFSPHEVVLSLSRVIFPLISQQTLLQRIFCS